MGGTNDHRCPPNPHYVKEENEYSVGGKAINQFAKRWAQREHPEAQSNTSIWELTFQNLKNH
jgi:hypothetical protein